MSNSTVTAAPWNIDSARNLYNIQRWGAKYFDINDAGHVVAKPLQDAGATVDITDVIEEAKSRGLKFPLLIRFQDILRHRVEAINLSFRNAIAECSQSRSTSSAKSWRKFWTRASRLISASKSAASRSCSPASRCKITRAASSSAMA